MGNHGAPETAAKWGMTWLKGRGANQLSITLSCTLVLTVVPEEQALTSPTVALGRHFAGKKGMRPLIPGDSKDMER